MPGRPEAVPAAVDPAQDSAETRPTALGSCRADPGSDDERDASEDKRNAEQLADSERTPCLVGGVRSLHEFDQETR